MDLDALFNSLQNSGMYDIVLPFILIFVVLYAILKKINFSTKAVQASISLVIAGFMVAWHALGRFPQCWDPINIILYNFPIVMLILIAMLALFMILGFIGAEKYPRNSIIGLVAILVFGYMMYIFYYAGVDSSGYCKLPEFFGIFNLDWIVPIIIIIAILWYIFKGKSDSTPPPKRFYPN